MIAMTFFIWVFIILGVLTFLTWYFSHRARHKERLLLIEKGMDIEKLNTKTSFTFPWLKLGIVIIGISIGLLIIVILYSNNREFRGNAPLAFGIFGICGGLALVLAHFIDKKSS